MGIPDDELQANADATLPDFYGPTKWPVEILVPAKELAEMRDEITRLKAANEKLTAELAAKEIRWTDAKPTTEGWWHYRSGGNHDDDYCILFCKEMNEEIVVHFLGGIWYAADMRGQWSDKPISQPEERTCELPQETK